MLRDTATLHQLARDAREHMTPAEIVHAAKIARANMLLASKMRDQWRRQVREDLGELPRFTRRAMGGRA